jgi:hypothetical protein
MFEDVVTIVGLCTIAGKDADETCEVGRFECVLGVTEVCAVGVDVKPLGVWCELDIDKV